jgi:hypothetical protein
LAEPFPFIDSFDALVNVRWRVATHLGAMPFYYIEAVLSNEIRQRQASGICRTGAGESMCKTTSAAEKSADTGEEKNAQRFRRSQPGSMRISPPLAAVGIMRWNGERIEAFQPDD